MSELASGCARPQMVFSDLGTSMTAQFQKSKSYFKIYLTGLLQNSIWVRKCKISKTILNCSLSRNFLSRKPWRNREIDVVRFHSDFKNLLFFPQSPSNSDSDQDWIFTLKDQYNIKETRNENKEKISIGGFLVDRKSNSPN